MEAFVLDPTVFEIGTTGSAEVIAGTEKVSLASPSLKLNIDSRIVASFHWHASFAQSARHR
jgi:hypothetical protein